ncbi:hypothetical protein QOZ80_5BG0447440 [Eleusine coracana subsp. coracana]|nr:hypothetical protein QOZ80_5BG0447440 [Eleusine coracana subsp. coracana]
MDGVFKLHGMPQAIISDRDKVFTSKFWQELFGLANTELAMSSAYHPQTDGQTERVNQCVEAYLRCFVQVCPTKWKRWLSLVEFWYNTCYHAALGKMPFEVLYGHGPKHLGIDTIESCAVPDLNELLTERDLMTKLLRQHLERVQQGMKAQADKHRSERTFVVGDWVYLKIQPYVQTSIVSRANYKLAFRYFGPNQIIQKINDVAYKLKLPDTSAVHPVFHVSQLKPAVGATTQVSTNIPSVTDQISIPELVLDHRLCPRAGKMIPQLLVLWRGWPASMATWEDEHAIKRQFPGCAAWGQVAPEGGKDVSVLKDSKVASSPKAPSAKASSSSSSQAQTLKKVADIRPRAAKPNPRFYGLEWVPKQQLRRNSDTTSASASSELKATAAAIVM